ncbi:MAG TPA: ornithine carbamoyltransferase [bacterium]|nr:ornithine carbamoyltransferase [bacterium]
MRTVRGRDYLSVRDLDPDELRGVLQRAGEVKAQARTGDQAMVLRGKTLALVFEKPSLRTRTTFETGMFQLGGNAVYLGPQDIQMGSRETPADVARNLDRWVDAIAARTFAQRTVETLAEHAHIPVINALSDWEHPCQALAALLTIRERFGRLEGVRLAWVGDGNNTLRSLVYGGARLGMSIVIATPDEYRLDAETFRWGQAAAKASGGALAAIDDPAAAVREADVIYTDVWTSMGQESSAAARRQVFQRFQVNAALLAHAPAHAVVTHCLPAHRGEEITDEVLDGHRSVAFDEAENRLHTQKALLAEVL